MDTSPAGGSGPIWWRRLGRSFVGATPQPGVIVVTPADRATIRLAGLDLPIRATIAIVVTVLVLLADYHRNFLPADILFSRDPAAMRTVAIERLALFGIVPLAIVVGLFRDDPRRYGLRLGDWRAGTTLAGIGVVVLAPVVIWLGQRPDFGAYYAPSATGAPDLILTNTLDLGAAEFLFRGFLMFALLRTIGPLAILVAAVPFAFSHLGKPELETLSALFGGTIFGWLDWRTGSILYSAAAHVALLTLVTLAAGGRI
ncbi:MAG: CPBP family intramembrane glutamic endopeptidase [Candidatus Limnocylindrales bacterium]